MIQNLDKKALKKLNEIHVVLSRDCGDYIFATVSKEIALKEKDTQTKKEEMNGGHPSVYILKTKLK